VGEFFIVATCFQTFHPHEIRTRGFARCSGGDRGSRIRDGLATGADPDYQDPVMTIPASWRGQANTSLARNPAAVSSYVPGSPTSNGAADDDSTSSTDCSDGIGRHRDGSICWSLGFERIKNSTASRQLLNRLTRRGSVKKIGSKK